MLAAEKHIKWNSLQKSQVVWSSPTKFFKTCPGSVPSHLASWTRAGHTIFYESWRHLWLVVQALAHARVWGSAGITTRLPSAGGTSSACAPSWGYQAKGQLSRVAKHRDFHWLDFSLASQKACGVGCCCCLVYLLSFDFAICQVCVTTLFTVCGIKGESSVQGLVSHVPGSLHTRVCRLGAQSHASTEEPPRPRPHGGSAMLGLGCCLSSCRRLWGAERASCGFRVRPRGLHEDGVLKLTVFWKVPLGLGTNWSAF